MSPVVQVENLVMKFGGITAVDHVDLGFEPQKITGLIGPNGAGKSTLFNCIAGLQTPSAGRIMLEGEDVTSLKPYQLFQKGLLRSFQVAHEFHSLSVVENLMMVPANQPGENLINAWFRPSKVRASEQQVEQKALDVLDFLEISHLRYEKAGNLSGGQKKLLELGRTMMVDAKIVFLDEVGAGVNRTLLKTISHAILRLRDEMGYTFCLIEHDMDFISRICDPVIVMAEGKVLANGTASEVMSDEAVIEAYLGRGLKQLNKNG